jgi:hypothetical protein
MDANVHELRESLCHAIFFGPEVFNEEGRKRGEDETLGILGEEK